MKKIIPNHVVIIPDGNRRWARKNGLKSFQGVLSGGNYNHLKSLFDEAKEAGIKYVSLWGFSTENWRRPKIEINSVFSLILSNFERFRADLAKDKTRFRHFGRKDRLPKKLLEAISILEKESKNFKDFNIQLCLDYGGRDEIVRAVNNIIKDKKKKVDEKEFAKYLDNAEVPDVDLIIRTSGEKRTSGLMPFQSVYAELYFCDKYFPDFSAEDMKDAIEEFSRRKRNFGK
ncbi:di-trans,poly-cis-decaprenylcistransferase [Candidatus Pacearchaeota archaeon CG_4_9_14_0_2_um_filter_39_13]|nr:di-trans,poly-cis-decaprenylcistransferase [Candidatus Pacearchaeota archaeon]OIO43900.1 MAG: di-trans,poly-cis-decaprenylcistransferase [Candidatus Pacearchaeota archaeon CG1_02_39_14]PJC44749.1 MAG: di-trans,poly-cis-decaprenylcistransferase [Candidatus Pacearchaeota archaeon CG_4_9_14_0_2_um_filter_39_13]